MITKRMMKKIGKYFIALRQENKEIIEQSVLIVDNGYSWLGQLNLAVEKIRNYFPKANISILTSEQRRYNLQRELPALNYIIPSQNLWPKRYQIALQMLKMPKKRFDFIVLSSLDITPLAVSLIFSKPGKLILHNRWGQSWSLRLRNVTEIFRVTYVKQETKFNLKNIIKRIGLFLVLLERKDEDLLKPSILVVDNGYALFEHLRSAILQIKESLPKAKISVLTFRQRKEFNDNFPEFEIIQPEEFILRKYTIARHMLRLRNIRYDYIILLSLDITPIIASILLMKGRALLYNQWHQWWTLKPKPLRQYVMAVPELILKILINIIVFIYLLISVSSIFLKRSFNVFKSNLLGGRS